MGGGLSTLVALKSRIRNEVKRLRRGVESAPVVILACSNIRDDILKYVRSDQVSDIVHDMDGSNVIAQAIQHHREEKTVLKAVIPLVCLLARTEKNATTLMGLKLHELLDQIQEDILEHSEPSLEISVLLDNIDKARALVRGMWAPEHCMDQAIEAADEKRVIFLLSHSYHLPVVSARAAAAVLDWAQNSPTNRDHLIQLQAHRYIIAALMKAPDKADIVANGAGALSELAKNLGASREIGRFGGVKVLVEAMTHTFLPIEAHQQCIWCLSQMTLVDENLSRMKEANVRLVVNEVKTRRVGHVVEQRDVRKRRGEAARRSVAYVANFGGETTEEKAFFVPRKLLNVKWDEVKLIHKTTHNPNRKNPREILAARAIPGKSHGHLDIITDSKPVCFVGALPQAGFANKVDEMIAKAAEEDAARAEGRMTEEEAAEAARLAEWKPDVTPRSEIIGGIDDVEETKVEPVKKRKSKKDGSESGSEEEEDSESSESDTEGLTMEEKAALERYRAGENAADFDEFLEANREGHFREKKVDARDEIRKIRQQKQGRGAFGGHFFRGADFLDADVYHEGDVHFEEDEATDYDLMREAPRRTDPYMQALNRELVPDQVEKFFDPETNSVRVRRKYSIVEKSTRFSFKKTKVVVPYQLKYFKGKGGIDPKLQPTYPLSAVKGHPDEVVNADPSLNRAHHTVPVDTREAQTPFYPSSFMSGLARE